MPTAIVEQQRNYSPQQHHNKRSYAAYSPALSQVGIGLHIGRISSAGSITQRCMLLGIGESAMHILYDGTRRKRSPRNSIHLLSHSLINGFALPSRHNSLGMIEEVGSFGIRLSLNIVHHSTLVDVNT